MSAKSRLSPEFKKSLLKKENKPTKNHQQQPNKLQKYLRHLPLLILSAPFYFLTYHILFNVYPQDIANIPLSNSYLSLLIPFFLANALLLNYLFLNSKRGTLLSLLLTILLFLKLQQFIFELWWIIPLVISFVIISWGTQKNAEFTKKTPLEKRRRD